MAPSELESEFQTFRKKESKIEDSGNISTDLNYAGMFIRGHLEELRKEIYNIDKSHGNEESPQIQKPHYEKAYNLALNLIRFLDDHAKTFHLTGGKRSMRRSLLRRIKSEWKHGQLIQFTNML